MKILLVEDDAILVEALVRALTTERYTVDVATDGEMGWELASASVYDVILLDVMLPKLDGISLCRRLRSHGSQTAILLLTAQDNSNSKVVGLDAGADDYMTKPFNLAELLARIRALQRRESVTLQPVLTWEALSLDPSTREVTCDGKPIYLRPREYDLLELFLRNPQRVFSRSAILDHLWSFDESPGEETITAHIKGLRQHLKAAGVPHDPIETVYGIGYRLHAETLTPTPEQTNTATAAIWERAKQRLSERIEVIEKATTAGVTDTLADDLRQQAEQEAHKLAGSLGMFNLDHGSKLAHKAEQAFQNWPELLDHERTQLADVIGQLRQTVQSAVQGETPTLFYPKTVGRAAFMPHTACLLVVSTDEDFQAGCASALTTVARDWTLQLQSDPIAACRLLSQQQPDVVLLDLTGVPDGETVCLTTDMVTFLTELQALAPPVPVLLRTDHDSLLDRVKASRLGCRGFVPSNATAAVVVETVIDLWMRSHADAAKVLVVDDDAQILEAMGQLLKPWGLKVYTLVDPRLFWDILNEVQPDVLVLDIEMPYVDGLALCQVVRSDLRWSHLPILFLTAHTDATTKHRVFAIGADDYVSKPIVGPELATRILNRLERSQLAQSQIEIDPLTRLATRRHAIQALTQTLALAHQQRQPVCIAMVTVDGLDPINQHYGYDAGDKILVHFAYLLHQTFVGHDVVGRWGGRLFIVAMYGLNIEDGKRRLRNLRKRQVPLPAGISQKQRPTMHAGFATYPPNPSLLEWPAADWSALVTKAIQQLAQASPPFIAFNNQKN
ncbi:response regulator receiver modulated diguanylate cyclase [Leptolyngbya sp. Heron Island J]|uniref:response regulator n=1 Tax=Leptolyngbya sp. Heron Island J TaxID=1385935 RepID=UPI0003B9864B|nr:response regulator [Leptolyngbya sp. Heron Island J]ESA35722.1 response regulator receiver modulated diguanylate cyclase [Leptolyngbya sp. Heron Island J]